MKKNYTLLFLLFFVLIAFKTYSKQCAPVTFSVITADPTADAGPDTTICKGTSVQLQSSGEGGNTFLWTPASGLSSDTVEMPIASPTVTTAYNFVSSNGTNSAEDEVVVTVVTCLGISEKFLLNSFDVFYNPNDKLIKIKFTSDEAFVIKLINSSGQLIEQEQHNSIGEFNKSYNMTGYSKGIYYLQITTKQGNATKKVVIE